MPLSISQGHTFLASLANLLVEAIPSMPVEEGNSTTDFFEMARGERLGAHSGYLVRQLLA